MGLKAFIKRQSRRVFGTDEFVLNLQEIKETLTGPFLADMSSQANTGRECVAYLEQQTEVIIQTYYINLLNYKPHLNEYFSDFIDNLLSISRYKKLKTNNLSNSCLNYFLLKQNELKAVCGKLDSASIDA
jgi:hypothetical protein